VADSAGPFESAKAIGRRLADLYAAIYEKSMRDVPVVNDVLSTQAIGFRPFDPYTIGIIITPWFMNLVAIPADTQDMFSDGAVQRIMLPAGDVDFISGTLTGFGRLYSASLFSPMFDFVDMESACLTAQEAMFNLFEASVPEQTALPEKNLDRRAFLRGSIGAAGR